jgi:hypothetical protein
VGFVGKTRDGLREDVIDTNGAINKGDKLNKIVCSAWDAAFLWRLHERHDGVGLWSCQNEPMNLMLRIRRADMSFKRIK